ncbi:hypothetical protein BDQ17DRAFT_1409660 [Cyathus striatus]|nr:hypothetical protein BDQ17DRAFT_1409660 [Cyathus striatus]
MPFTLSGFSCFSSLSTQPEPVFPPELLLQIVSHVTCPRTLSSLLRTSVIFRADAEKSLYSGDWINYNTWSERKHTHFLRTIASSPRLAALVRVYSARYFPAKDEFTSILRSALEAMTNLEELTYQSIEPALQLLEKCTFRLQSFTLLSANENPRSVLVFLGNQLNLRHIALQQELTRRMYRMIWKEPHDPCYTKNGEAVGHFIFQVLCAHLSDQKGASINKDTFFHFPVDRAGIIEPNDPSVTHTLSRVTHACIGKRPEGKWRGAREPILRGFVNRLENVTNMELVNRPEADVDSARYLSSLKTLAITFPVFPVYKIFKRTRYLQDLFQKFELLEDLYVHCLSLLDTQRPSEEWVYERWTKDGKGETKTRGEWRPVFVAQWDLNTMAISRHTPLTRPHPNFGFRGGMMDRAMLTHRQALVEPTCLPEAGTISTGSSGGKDSELEEKTYDVYHSSSGIYDATALLVELGSSLVN